MDFWIVLKNKHLVTLNMYSMKLLYEPSPEPNESESVSQSALSDSLRSHGVYQARLLCPWNSPGKNTGVGCHSLLQSNSQPKDQT